MKSKKIIFVILIIVIGISFVIFRFIKADKLNQNSMANSKYCYNEKLDKEDSALFKNSELNNVKSTLVLKSSFRNDIKCFNYSNQGKIHLIKIDIINDIPMDQFIWFREVATEETTMHTYSKFSIRGKFDFLILGEKIPKVNKIIFSLTGDGNQIKKNVYNKNFVSYYLPVSTFSLRYGEDAPTDIFFGGKETLSGGRNTYPLMISFYKRHKSLYVLIFVPDRNEMNLDGDLFGKIMNDNNSCGE